jgi:hypothetical protein
VYGPHVCHGQRSATESSFGHGCALSSISALSCGPVSYPQDDTGTLDIQVAKCYHTDMSQPVKLSDDLVLDARLMADASERSLAGQIEFWARLGRAIEPLLTGDQVRALQAASGPSWAEMLDTVGTPVGRQRVADYLKTRPFPHYEAAPGEPGWLIRIEADGTRLKGRFVNRRFVSID